MQVMARLRPVLGAALLGLCTLVQAQSAGEVEFARGVGFVQSPGQQVRTLGKGVPLKQGDRLTTSEGASAIIKLEDGTKMTLRPNSELLLEEYRFRAEASDNSMVMNLLRGGFRAITGLISKRSPDAARINTRTATIGIRGTDFDARLCGPTDCKNEAGRVAQTPRPSQVQASAKVVTMQGLVQVVDGAGQTRPLAVGGSIYPGETVETLVDAKAVIAFRDETRMTLGAATKFKIDDFVYDDKAATEGRFFVSLVTGSVRALTGLIGKAERRNVRFGTVVATIGIRGTGLDIDCPTDVGCSFFSWQGSIEVIADGQTAGEVLETGQGLYVGRDGNRPLTDSPVPQLERPDAVPVDFNQLFTVGPSSADQEGLYVHVRDGHIEVVAFGETVQLGKGETAYAVATGTAGTAGTAGTTGTTGTTGTVQRLPATPLFIDYDQMPMPDARNPGLISVLNSLGISSTNTCK